MQPLRIAIPIYPQVDLIDVTVTFDALSRIADYWIERTLELHVVGPTLDPVLTGQNLPIVPTKTFDDYEGITLDALIVPGAYQPLSATKLDPFMSFVRTHGPTAQITASVCTGALILATAGLLDGYRATTHWAAINSLTKISQNVRVVNGFPRWVHDRNRLTTGGISSSLDGTLYLISLLTDEQTAKCAQLILQYDPQPPFQTGDPSVADTETYLRVAYGGTS